MDSPSTVRKFFGTDGVRGPYGGPVINERFAYRLGAAAGRWLISRGTVNALVVIGRDTRASGESLTRALAAGLSAQGVQPCDLGILPTPAVARAVVTERAALGVVVTASHNSAADNGIKFFGAHGVKLTDADELQIESWLRDEALPTDFQLAPLAARPAIGAYVAAMAALLPPRALAGWRIVLDTAHGATAMTSPLVLRALGAEVIGIGDAPDGMNINADVGSEHPEQLAARVMATGAQLGIAHDGDGDRCVLCDETGSILDGDEILTVLATHAQGKGALQANTLVVTVQSNFGVDAALAALGGRVLRTAVGDRYVIEKMRAAGATLGGESSGHIICADISPTGDGLVAALKVIAVMLATSQPLSELRKVLKKFPQVSATLKVREKRALNSLTALAAAIRALETELGAAGRVLVRYSGTEPKLRFLVEGRDLTQVRAGLDRIVAVARTELEVP